MIQASLTGRTALAPGIDPPVKPSVASCMATISNLDVNCQRKSPRVAIETPHLRRVAEVGQVLVITPLRVSSSRRRWVRIR